jgi:hypothetical protein
LITPKSGTNRLQERRSVGISPRKIIKGPQQGICIAVSGVQNRFHLGFDMSLYHRCRVIANGLAVPVPGNLLGGCG